MVGLYPQGGRQGVEYHVVGPWGENLEVDDDGGVKLRRRLDREGRGGGVGVVRVVGVDRGQPPLSATATLTITVTDINDSPPSLLPPTTFHVAETSTPKPSRLGTLTATDRDVWALGHGPPFNISLAPSNPPFVLAHVTLRFDQRM